MEIYNQSRAKRNKYKFQNCYNRILIYNSEQNEIEKNEICCLSNEVVNFDTNTIETINIPITRADSIESTTENNELQMREKVFLISPEVSESKLIGKTNSEIIILDDDSSGLDAQKLNEQSNEPCKNDPIEKVNCLKIENKEKKETYLDDPIQDIKTRESSASSTKVRIDKSQIKIKRKRSRTRSASRSRSRRSRTRSRSRSWNRRRSRSTSRHRDYYKSYANSRYNEYYDYYSYYSYYYPDYYGYDDSDYSRDGVKYKSKTRSKSKSRTKSRSRSRSRSKRSNRRSRSRSMSRTKNFRS
ncbi:unnamed protein product [Brachionus calyciflorus]|uniref:Uncharacterized protein n=1 Tax=Brachionus calyciflorus TaxID=104777 RepID=A0A813WEZ7_9BILA|nr:unnamed protein product [Brachionus calyciflorus]